MKPRLTPPLRDNILSMIIFYFLGIFLVPLNVCRGDFIYKDFNQSLGLAFNGNASISICNETKSNVLSSNVPLIDEHIMKSMTNDGGLEISEKVMTIDRDVGSDYIDTFVSQFGHRELDSHVNPYKGCKRRLRLTASSPSQAGSVFYDKRLPVVSQGLRYMPA